MYSSYGIGHLLAPIFSMKQSGQKQLFSDVVHLNQATSDPSEEDNFLPFSLPEATATHKDTPATT